MIGSLIPEYWLKIVGFLLSWIICDTVITYFVEKIGPNAIRIRLLNWHFQSPGNVYIAFFVGILVASVASNLFVESVLSGATTPTGQTLLVSSLAIAAVVYVDLRVRYY